MDHLCFVSFVSHAFASVHCFIVVICRLLLVLCIAFLCILGQVWYLIVSFRVYTAFRPKIWDYSITVLEVFG